MINAKDTEAISAYLDGNLDPRERERLEARLEREPGLRAELNALDRTRRLLRTAPQYRAPRNFTLTPEMAGIRTERPGFLFGLTRLGFTMTTILFVVALVGNFTFQGLAGVGNQAPIALSSEADPAAESFAAAPAPGEDAAGAVEEPMPETAADSGPADSGESVDGEQVEQMMVEESVDPGESVEDMQSLAPPAEESLSVEEEAAADSQPVEDPVAEGTIAATENEGARTAPVTIEAAEPEVASLPADADQPVEPETSRINPWSIFTVLTGAAALLSGALTLALRRR